ncbi:phosphatidate cytidylyltransferase [Chitiniphilus shinanonensis]|uniref:Phosphatidate cytidylyltransferase n=1 Tax=Chitiniphilus shinanonensis TaxID=553088 RepID=A0ABQ6BRZ6_9NEIS|nr:phosphatidate cytidylyltransferase [Chitiniphilus shinanonensis]GLS04127.1 phosphatidate cytidylyltransferase [Chitiniphilus shinanonensis]
MLKTRILTALVLLPLVLLALFLLPHGGWVAFAAIVCGAGAWEWSRLCGLNGAGAWLLPALVAVGVALLAPGALPIFDQPWWPVVLAAALFWLLGAPAWLRWRWPLAATLAKGLPVGFLLLLGAGLSLIALRGAVGPWGVLATLAIAWVADTAAYFSGKAFGRRKLAPSISPGKTWEGVIGAALAVTAYALVIAWTAQLSWWKCATAALLLMVVSIAGDLLESLFKRQAGIKDSSNLLPGHGGVLDRIDSLVALMPLALPLLYWLVR